MNIQQSLSRIANNSPYSIEFIVNGDPVLIVKASFHYIPCDFEDHLIEILRPRVILAEELVDSQYIASKDIFEHGEFYKKRATHVQKRNIENSTIVDNGRQFTIDVVGIDIPYDAPVEEKEEYLFERMGNYAKKERLIYAAVGADHLQERSRLICKLLEADFNSAILQYKAYSALLAQRNQRLCKHSRK